MATRRFASALENIARLSKKWRYWERERERGESGELARQVACGSSAMGGANAGPRLSLPLYGRRGGEAFIAIGRQPVREVVPTLIILNKSSPLRRLIIEFAVP